MKSTGNRVPRDEGALLQLGARIRELRLLRDEAQDVFAWRAQVPRAHIGLIENGKIDLRYSTLSRIAAALEISLSELLLFPEVNEKQNVR